jgi:glycosyltransferase involved in cell wall biosynthesis
MKILSIAIAAYNMEKYLAKCLDSVLLPKIIDNLEVIIVNDGSTDSTFAIANQYKEKYSQSVIVIDKSNGHTGSCWNAALKIAAGKYFRTLDADDWFDSKALISLMEKLQALDIDMILTNYSFEYMLQGKSVNAIKQVKNIVANKEYDHSNAQLLLDNPRLIEMHAITYKTQLLKNMNFTWTEGIAYTDSEYVFYPQSYIQSFMYIDMVLYKYLLGREGQTMAKDVQIKSRNMLYIILKNMLSHSLQNPINRVQEYKLETILQAYYGILLCLSPKNNEDEAKLKEIDELLLKGLPALHRKLQQSKHYLVVKYINLWRKKGSYWSECRTKKGMDWVKNLLCRR